MGVGEERSGSDSDGQTKQHSRQESLKATGTERTQQRKHLEFCLLKTETALLAVGDL